MTDPYANRHPAIQQIMRYFAWAHLPAHLQETSHACSDLAGHMVALLPDSPELTAGLRKLLEAKDCFVRTALDAAETEWQAAADAALKRAQEAPYRDGAEEG